MPTRITVTRSSPHGKSRDEEDGEDATPIKCSSEEIASPNLNNISDNCAGDEQVATETKEVLESETTTAAETAADTVPSSSPTAAGVEETVKNNAEPEEEKRDTTLGEEEEIKKNEDVGAYIKVR